MAYKVTIYEWNIARMFAKSKDVARFSERFARKAVRIAKGPEYTPGAASAPDPRPWKSENLRESNRHRGYLRAGRTLGQVVMENTASYARHAWRRGPVWAHSEDKDLQVPRVHVGGGKGFVYLREVKGHWDYKDHWLERAVKDAAKGRI